MGNAERIEETWMQPKTSDGKDEMNLAEFPLCALSRRLRPDQKTLRFEDRLYDNGRREWITRQLTITGSDLFGLPTALDDEVLLGLIQLSRQRDFADRKVPFTRHELLRLLDWRDDSKNYHRLEASLNRWTGVTLYYQKAWWNKARKCWVDEKFHVLDNVWLCHRGEPPPDTGLDEAAALTSAFVWNEVIFRSFQAGNLKSIDFEFFKSLDSAVAKRMYRFLDKRFWNRGRWEFKLREFACQHLGLSQSYDISNLKRKLLPGIHELETRGYLAAVSEAERFRKLRAGEWIVRFEEGRGIRPTDISGQVNQAGESTLAEKLIARGVSPEVADEVCATRPVEAIQQKMKVFDWLVQRCDPKISRNPPGFLVSSIKLDYEPPSGFNPPPMPKKAARRNGHPQKQSTITADAETATQKIQNEAVREYWQSLTPLERERLESEAIAAAPKLERELIERGGTFAAPTRRMLRDAYVAKMLPQRVE